MKQTNKEISVETDASKFRPVDVPIVECDFSKLKGLSNWFPEIPINKTLLDVLNYWRDEINTLYQ